MTDYETLAALGFTPRPAENSGVDQASAGRPDVAERTPGNVELPSRRSLRAGGVVSVPPVAASNVPDSVVAVAAPVDTAAAPVQYSSRRAAREAALVSAAPVAAAPVTPAPVVPTANVSAPSVAAPFGIFAPTVAAPTAAESNARPAPAVAQASRRNPVRKQLSVAGTMVLIGGLFASLTLPAYASSDYNAVALDAALPAETQEISLDAAEVDAAAASGDARDGYAATSAADLKRLHLDAIRQQNLAAYLASGAKEMGDDYPWAAELADYQGGGLSPLNYFYRECVDFVAWRLNRDAGYTQAPFKWVWSTLTPGAGSARSWKSQWEKHGWPISATPAPGWVAWFPGANHVSYVSGILDDGSVAIEEYNWGPNTYGQRVIQPGDAIYLSPPPA